LVAQTLEAVDASNGGIISTHVDGHAFRLSCLDVQLNNFALTSSNENSLLVECKFSTRNFGIYFTFPLFRQTSCVVDVSAFASEESLELLTILVDVHFLDIDGS
jgi:hypothetical protein